MKRVLKGAEPPSLTTYRNAVPNGTWKAMRGDPHHGGQNAYTDCRAQTIEDQGGLCAYCEIGIRDNDPLKSQIEHFHPKSDKATAHNWALDWGNLLAVCNGGHNPHVSAVGFYLAPLDANLSCDAHKERMITAGKLAAQCEGWILNPLQLQANPSLFELERGSGKLIPNIENCAAAPAWLGNKHASIAELVQHTIDMLNLNCDRLTQARRQIIWNIEQNKKKQRQAGYTPQQGLDNLAQRYFQTQWHDFFTTIRICLGQVADAHLHSMQFQG